MRFEHDNYDVDVYSLCESVYYSCNNDEYDYVLECVNDWIMNGYNDTILLEELRYKEVYADPEVERKHKELYKTYRHIADWVSGTRERQYAQFSNLQSHRFKHPETHQDIARRLYNMDLADVWDIDQKNGNKALTSRVYDEYDAADKEFMKKLNGRLISHSDQDRINHELLDDYKRLQSQLPSSEKKKVLDLTRTIPRAMWIRQQKRDFLQQKSKDIQNQISQYVQSVEKIHGKDQSKWPRKVKIAIELMELEDRTKGNNKTRNKRKEELETELQELKSNTPLKDKKGRTIKKLGTGFKGRKFNPVQTPPNTPPIPQQQEPPNSNTPVIPNNQSRLSRATTWMKNNKGKTALGVGLGAAAIGGSIYAYKQYKNKPRSVIAKRIAALRGVYHKFMINAQRNPQKANIFKRIAAKILSVIDKLMAFMQNTADGR